MEIQMTQEIAKAIQDTDRVLIGIGEEWSKQQNPNIQEAYQALYDRIKDKDYFIVTTLTDTAIFDSPFDTAKIVAPCGNDSWRQCEKACTKDIWEEGEIPDEICPHCGAKLVPNTIQQETYIEEGYLAQWGTYTNWLQRTLNRELVILELGEGFLVPTVMRWPFEKIVFFNRKAKFYRVHKTFPQVSEEIREYATSVKENSVKVIFDISALP